MTLTEQLDKLAQFEPAPYPVVSLYLNTQPGPNGRDQYQAFIRAEFKARSRTYPAGSPERDSLDKDLERIATYLEKELEPSANGVAVFACSAGELFEAVQLSAPIDQHWLYIGDAPHLYPLARIESQYPRYAAVVLDTNNTRIMVFAMGELISEQAVKGVKTRRTSQGGWSQARFQRHIENYHVQHVKEVVEALDRVVQQERITQIVVVADDVAMPLLREQLPQHLAEKIVDHLKADAHAPIQQVLEASLEAMSQQNARTDHDKVGPALSAADTWEVRITGKQAHGARPELSIDPVVTAAQFVQALQTIRSRTLSGHEPGVVTIGSIHGGQRHNIIPAEVTLTGTIRTFRPEMSTLAEQRLRAILKGVTEANGATGEVVRYERGAPATINDAALTSETIPALERAVGKDRVTRIPPAMGSEDFSFFANEIPGFFYRLGQVKAGTTTGDHHTPTFRADDGAIPVGIKAMSYIVYDYLSRQKGSK